MFYIESIPGNQSEFLLFDFTNSTVNKKNKEEISSYENVYCFDLSGMVGLFGESLPFIIDLQSLYGLHLNRTETLEELFDPNISPKLIEIKSKIISHMKSYAACNISTEHFELEQLIPEDIVSEFYKQKLVCLRNLIQKSSFDEDIISFYKAKFEEIVSILRLSKNSIVIDGKNTSINYQVFGSKNSRLSIKKNNFNLFNVPKDKRGCVKAPQGYTLCQFDFKSFQPRLALSIFGDEKIKQKLRENDDIYSLFAGDREENKIELISWMFSNRRNDKFDDSLSFIKKSRKILHDESRTGKVLNFFKRPLFFTEEEDNVVFQNYICSVEADCIISLIKDVQIELEDSKSYLAFPFHDCLVFCIFNEEIGKINQLKAFIEKYLYDSFNVNFPVSIKQGSTFGTLKDFSQKSLQTS
jgi:hypothetical protein